MIDERDFDDWLGQQITQDVFDELRKKAAECKDRWLALSWEGETPDPAMLIRLKAYEEIMLQIAGVSHGDIYESAD